MPNYLVSLISFGVFSIIDLYFQVVHGCVGV